MSKFGWFVAGGLFHSLISNRGTDPKVSLSLREIPEEAPSDKYNPKGRDYSFLLVLAMISLFLSGIALQKGCSVLARILIIPFLVLPLLSAILSSASEAPSGSKFVDYFLAPFLAVSFFASVYYFFAGHKLLSVLIFLVSFFILVFSALRLAEKSGRKNLTAATPDSSSPAAEAGAGSESEDHTRSEFPEESDRWDS